MMAGLPGIACRRRVYLMRHGDVVDFDEHGRPLDPRHVPLSETGRRHARAAGELLGEVAFDLAISSGMPRTEETARLVLGSRALTPRAEPRLKEIRSGRLREVPAMQRAQIIAGAYERAGEAGADFIGGETWAGLQARVLEVWQALMAEPGWLEVLIVAHDAVNRVLLAHVAGAGLSGLKAFEQDPACINIIEVDVEDGRARHAFIRAANLTAYNLVASGNHLTVMEKVLAQFKPE